MSWLIPTYNMSAQWAAWTWILMLLMLPFGFDWPTRWAMSLLGAAVLLAAVDIDGPLGQDREGDR